MVEGLDDHLLEEANREERASEQLARGKFEALGSGSVLPRCAFDGAEFASGSLAVGSEGGAGLPGYSGPAGCRTGRYAVASASA